MEPAGELTPRLEAWSLATHGAGARVRNVRSLGGHSGFTVGFDVMLPGRDAEELVLKIPPAGVKWQNNFDVLRQVPVLRVLEAHGVPAPRARWWSDDASAFGTPYLVMSRLRGGPLPDVFGPDAGRGVVAAERQFGEAIGTLVQIHSIAAAELADWNNLRLLSDEIDHWVQVLHKSADAEWTRKGMAVRDLLHRSAPRESAVGIVHGDYYSNNWLYDDGRLSGIVDWESASLGPVLLDLGWVCMMYDPESWGALRRRRMEWHPGPDRFMDRYASLSGTDLADISWYRALAGYRLACLTAYYFERHRTGKRPNPAWDVMAESFPFMLDRASALLEGKGSR